MEQEFTSIENSYTRPFDWNAFGGVLRPGEFVDWWRIVFWNKAFIPFFEAKDLKFIKGSHLLEFVDGRMAIKQVVYRCISASTIFHSCY